MKIALIEDERPARERLRQMIRSFDPAIEVVAELPSVREAKAWLTAHSEPDLIIVDIQLSDGLSFDIFEAVPIRCPLIFATAYDEYILRALQHNGIDYLLKPIKPEALQQALRKYRQLQQHFTGDLPSLMRELHSEQSSVYRRRITVQKGSAFHSIRTEDIAFCFTEHKLVFLVTSEGEKYLVDRPLYELEAALNPRYFFRLNRKYLARIDAIRRFQPCGRGKLKVELEPEVEEEVVVSQERAGDFRVWLDA